MSRRYLVEYFVNLLAIPNGHASILLPNKIVLESGTSRNGGFSERISVFACLCFHEREKKKNAYWYFDLQSPYDVDMWRCLDA